MREITRIPRILFVFGVVLALFVAAVANVAAQQNIDFTIAKFNCLTDPGELSLAKGDFPSDCTRAAGVSFSVHDTGGNALGTCTTDANGICKLSLPDGITVVATETGGAKAGFVPREKSITAKVLTEFASAVFVNLPASQVVPATGQARGGHGSSEALLLSGAAGAALLGLALRSRSIRRARPVAR